MEWLSFLTPLIGLDVLSFALGLFIGSLSKRDPVMTWGFVVCVSIAFALMFVPMWIWWP